VTWECNENILLGSRNIKEDIGGRRTNSEIGLGQTWWTAKRRNESYYRPVLFGTDGLVGGSISGLNMKNSPMWFNVVMNSSDVLITDINIWNEVTNSSSPPAVSYPRENYPTSSWEFLRIGERSSNIFLFTGR
jgi:polygalacturonase